MRFRHLASALLVVLSSVSFVQASHPGKGACKRDAICNIGWNLVDHEAPSSCCPECEYFPAYDDPAWPGMRMSHLVENRCRKKAFTSTPPLGPPPNYIPDCCGYSFTFEVDALALTRDTGSGQRILSDTDTSEELSARGFDFGYQWGPRFRFTGCYQHSPVQFEFIYWGVHGWSSRQSSNAPGALLQLDFQTTLAVNNVSAIYETQLDNLEFNYYFPMRKWCGWRLLLGFRWMELDEDYFSEGVGVVSGLDEAIDVSTYNRLYGFQLGFDKCFGGWYNGNVQFNWFLKGGVYHNRADTTNRYLTESQSVSSVIGNRTGTAFAGETGLVLNVQATNNWSFKCGYQVLWLEGVALAPDQLASTSLFNPPGLRATVSTGSGLLYHGGFLGMEFRR